MNELVALLLGVVQGLTEFLPVSSSGHLELAKALFQADFVAKESLLFTITLHGATALSTLVFFRKDIGFIFKELLINFRIINRREKLGKFHILF